MRISVVDAHFDASGFIPLVIEEPGSEVAGRLWDEADYVVSVRLAEARAALAGAERTGRVTRRQLPRFVEDVDSLYSQLDYVGVDETLVRRADDLASAQRLDDTELVLLASDGAVIGAAGELGFAVAGTG